MQPLRSILLAAALGCACLFPAPAALAQDAAADVGAAAIPPGKLPDLVQPQAYRLDLTVDPTQARFSGRVEIDVDLRRAAPQLFIHGRDLAMHRAEARIGGQVIAAQWQQLDDSGVARLSFDAPLPAGPVTLAFEYDAPFGDNPSGLYRVKVGDDWYGWSQLQSIDARAVFPAFDEPGFKTPFTITLRTRPGDMAVSNAPEASKLREGAFDVHRFAPTLPLPTYLVAVVAGPFVAEEGAVRPTPQRPAPLPLRIISTKNNAGRLAFALKGSQEIVARLESYFGDAFPYPKLDQITSPIMPGAMENAGADIYADRLLVVEENAPTGQKRSFGMVVAHELSHQWFGDLVTPAWWDDIWLNESFANWMGFRIGGEWRPDLNIGAGAVEEGFAAMDTDALIAGRPIRQAIATSNDIDAAFDSITYGKGGHVVAMIAAFMGDEKFRAGVRRYMAAHRYGSATSADFFAAMAQEAGDPRVLPAMQGFVDQQGVPLLTFTGSRGRYRVSQSRYAPLGAVPPATRWAVPLCARRGAVRRCALLAEEAMDFALSGTGPLMPNAGGTGYYRFELPARDWDSLIARADRLSGSEALALADSLDASFRAGRATIGQLAALSRKLARNRDSYANGAALATLESLVGKGMAGDAPPPAWQAFVLALAAPDFQRLGFDPRAGAYAGQDAEQLQARALAAGRMAMIGRDPALRTRLADAAAAYLAGDAAALDPAWFALAFDAHAERDGSQAVRAMVDQALGSADERFRMAALGAAGRSGREDIARWLLDDVQDARLRTPEKRQLLAQIVTTGPTGELGYAWLKAHIETYLRGGGIFASARLPAMLGGFCSVERAADMAASFRAKLAGTPAALSLERVIEQVGNCGRLKAARGAEITAELAKIK